MTAPSQVDTHPSSLLAAGRRVTYRRVDDIRLEEFSFDRILPEQCVVRVEACGICGTDIQAILRGAADYLPVGHEVAGRVVNADGSLREGGVVLESSSACGRCSACRDARPDLCTGKQSFFRRPYLGLADRMTAPAISVVPYEGMSPEVASLSEPLAVAVDMLEVAPVRVGSVVLVVGLGPIGLMALRLAKLGGAGKIYAATFSGRTARNQAALDFGADELLYEDEEPLAERKLDPPPDCILNTAPPTSIASCVEPSALGGTIVFIGLGHGATDRIELPANRFHFKKLQLRSSFAAPALRTPMALRLLKSGQIDGERLITHRFPMEDAAEAIRVACTNKRDAIKVVVTNPIQ